MNLGSDPADQIVRYSLAGTEVALKLSGLVDTGGQAKMLIQEGHVLVGGEPCPLRGKKLYPGDSFSLGDREFQVARAEG